jgi:hypothetical protein
MTCCGRNRPDRRASEAQRRATGAAVVDGAPVTGGVFFSYLGATGLTVVGPATGRTYQFFGRGARAAVDRRDAPSVAAVPHLVRVPHP